MFGMCGAFCGFVALMMVVCGDDARVLLLLFHFIPFLAMSFRRHTTHPRTEEGREERRGVKRFDE